MKFVLTNPFIRPLAAFVLGILFAFYFSFQLEQILLWGGVVMIIFFFLLHFNSKVIIHRSIEGMSILFLFFFFGLSLSLTHQNNRSTACPIDKGTALLKIKEIPKPSGTYLKCKALLVDSVQKCASSYILINLSPDSNAYNLMYGDLILVNLNPFQIENDGNPGSFDYKAYMKTQGVFYQAKLGSKDWIKITKRGNEFEFLDWTQLQRHKIVNQMQNSILHADAQALVSALVLGYKGNLDKDLKDQFVSAGVVHVLAVSGMHVGIIYLVLQAAFFFLKHLPFGRWIQFVLIISFLWFYVFLAGFAPSVLRAATMFSLFNLGKTINRKASVYNIMAASAFILLLANPSQLFQLGFLFSYFAVLGILIFHQRITSRLKSKWRLINYVIAMMALSFSAQLVVTPLSLHYFHQFPLYFLLANLVILPLIIAFIYPAVAYVLLLSFPQISDLIARFLNVIYKWIFYVSEFFHELPYVKIQNINLPFSEMFLWYVFLIILIAYMLLKKPGLVNYSILSISLIVGLTFYNNIRNHGKSQLVVYNSFYDQVFSIKEGNVLHMFHSAVEQDRLLKLSSNYRMQSDIDSLRFYDLSKLSLDDSILHKIDDQLYAYKGFLLWRNRILFDQSSSKINIDHPPDGVDIIIGNGKVISGNKSEMSIVNNNRIENFPIRNDRTHVLKKEGAFILNAENLDNFAINH